MTKAGQLNVEFLTNGSDVVSVLNQTEKSLSRILKTTRLLNSNSSGTTANGGAFSFLNVAKWTSAIYAGQRLGRIVADIAQAGADYTETLNLWETAMGKNITLANEFISKMNEAYGISEKTLMNAQATFKNMLGSLGQISDSMAYALSEGITQMAIDYASLYNQQFEKAFEKFQSALAGQVRPIRSVSGFDITENTIYQLYQQLGGTKSVRNLQRVEKQLLGLLAIFGQMERSGAIGDLNKTMESFANQSRVSAEAWDRVKTYAGTLLTFFIQESNILTYVNAVLIFIGDTLKALAEDMNAIQHFGGDIFGGVTDSALTAGKSVDELKGKLLGFDKFSSLGGSQDNVFGLDETLLNAFSKYKSVLENASLYAQELADKWKETSGLFTDGVFNREKWDSLVDTIKSVGVAILSAFAISKIMSFATFLYDTNTRLQLMYALMSKTGQSLFSFFTTSVLKLTPTTLIISGIIALLGILYTTNEYFRESVNELFGTLTPLFNVLVGIVGQVLKPVLSILTTLLDVLGGILGFVLKITTGIVYFAETVAGIPLLLIEFVVKGLTTILYLLDALINWSWGELGGKLSDLWGNWSSVDLMVSGAQGIEKTVLGKNGLPDTATVSRANSIDAGISYNTTSSQGSVMTIQQMAQSTRQGTLDALDEWWAYAKNEIPQFREVSKTGIYEIAKSEAVRRGDW